MIGSAYQQGTYVRVISPKGQILFTQKGKLLGYTNDYISIVKGDSIHICNHQGSTISTYRHEEALEDSQPRITCNGKSILFYLLFGWLVKICAAYRFYQFLGRGNAIGNDGGDLDWKGIGIWIMSILFWITCFTVIK